MKKVFMIASLFGAGLLSACNNGPSTPAKTDSQVKAESLLGTWQLTYTIKSTFTDTIKFSEVLESDETPGDYFAAGYDQDSVIYVGWYDYSHSTYVIGNGSTALPQLFTFSGINGNSISGCVVFKYAGTWTDCYAFTGKRISTSASLSTMSTAATNSALQSAYLRLKAARP